MSEKKSNYVYRLCPCNPSDVETMQSWLEDMAAEGLFLIKEGIFCNILFTFERRLPQKVTYRFDVAQKRKSRFMDGGDQLTSEELELYQSMGWEYLLQMGDFRIYRTAVRDAPELNTESEIHAMTIEFLKKKHRSSFFWAIVSAFLWLFVVNGALGRGFLVAATVGLLCTVCLYGILLSMVAAPLFRMIRFRRYEKRLLAGDSLNHPVKWKKKRFGRYGALLLSLLLWGGVGVGLLDAHLQAAEAYPIENYSGEPPFATIADIFPDAEKIERYNMLDYYGTYETTENPVSNYTKWKDSCYVTTADGERYFCILIVDYYDTVSDWFARGVETDWYLYDSTRHGGKNFEKLDAPGLDVDSIRTYNNYGSFTVLMREGNQVVHAVVLLDDGANQNQWQLWAEAMAGKMK